MRLLRKAAILVAAATMTLGLGVSSPANAQDTGWDCPGCRSLIGH
jgi:hypothetical protein